MSSGFVFQSVAPADCLCGKQPSWRSAWCAAGDGRHRHEPRHGRKHGGRLHRAAPFPCHAARPFLIPRQVRSWAGSARSARGGLRWTASRTGATHIVCRNPLTHWPSPSCKPRSARYSRRMSAMSAAP